MSAVRGASAQRGNSLPDARPHVVLSHLAIAVPQQPLRVRQVAGVGGRLCANIPELEIHACQAASFVETRAETEGAQRLAIVVLNQPGAQPLPRPGVDALDQRGRLAGQLDGALGLGLVLPDPEGAAPQILALDLRPIPEAQLIPKPANEPSKCLLC